MKAPLDELVEAAALALRVRLVLDRVVAESGDLGLVEALERFDAVCAPHAHALLLLDPDQVERLVGPDDVLDPLQWWGIHERLDQALPDETLDALLSA